MSRVDPKELGDIQYNTCNIRNICILAHVDHGKTTLSDSLVCSNGVISNRLAGKVRFLDSTEEEQRRGITMHSSAISLLYNMEEKQQQAKEIDSNDQDNVQSASVQQQYLINLVDSPGHIDFSSDVSTATRLCDGALIIVDVLEGMCTQTHAVLYKALKERMRPCLILNKIDRLTLEMKLSPTEAFHHMRRIVENVNALAFTLLNSEFRSLREAELELSQSKTTSEEAKALIVAEDIDLDDPLVEQWTFSPEKGNVIFASALDCWGFGIIKFANIWAKKLNVNNKVLQKYLFDDYTFNPKTKKIVKCDYQDPNSKPMFASMILEPIWQLYDVGIAQSDPEKAAKMAARGIGVQIGPREINVRDPRSTVQAILRQWLPLPDSILRMVIRCIPNPIDAQQARIKTLITQTEVSGSDIVVNKMEKVLKNISNCEKDVDAEVVVFVSKMTPVRVGDLCAKDLAMVQSAMSEKLSIDSDDVSSNNTNTSSIQLDPTSEIFMALGRVFSGTLRRNSNLYILGHRHDPLILEGSNTQDVTSVFTNIDMNGEPPSCMTSVKKVPNNSFGMYICLGPSVFPVEEVPAGNIVGIIGLEGLVLKTATISSTWACNPMKAITFQAKPMVCVAVEPISHRDLSRFESGLQSLYQYDPVVEIGVDENGQHTLTCLGELHLEQCLKALTERFAKCEVKVSEPLVSFRETILPFSSTFKVHLPPPWCDIEGIKTADKGKLRTVLTGNNLAITFNACSLPAELIQFLDKDTNSINALLDELVNRAWEHEDVKNTVSPFWLRVTEKIIECSDFKNHIFSGNHNELEYIARNLYDRLVAIGSRNIGTSMLFLSPAVMINVCTTNVNSHENLESNSNNDDILKTVSLEDDRKLFMKIWSRLQSAIAVGFQLAMGSGPLMNAPIHGLCFSVEKIEISRQAAFFINNEEIGIEDTLANSLSATTLDSTSISAGQLIAEIKDSLRILILSCPVRVVEPIYACELQCDQGQLGNLYGVLSKRRGEVVKEDVIDGTSLFLLSATIPVSESFGFAQELLKKTSGNGTAPQLLFSHWQIIDIDPFWKPSTEEELENFGDQAGEHNFARNLIDKIRKSKGLPIEEKIVKDAEKQRNMNKKK